MRYLRSNCAHWRLSILVVVIGVAFDDADEGKDDADGDDCIGDGIGTDAKADGEFVDGAVEDAVDGESVDEGTFVEAERG